MRLRRRRKVSAIASEGGAEFRDAQRAVRDAQAAADHAAALLPQMAALRERLREMRLRNHFSESYAAMLRQGYGPPPRRGGT